MTAMAVVLMNLQKVVQFVLIGKNKDIMRETVINLIRMNANGMFICVFVVIVISCNDKQIQLQDVKGVIL